MNNSCLQYVGYKDTPQLWHGNFHNIHQFILKSSEVTYSKLLPHNMRLGNRVEDFVKHNIIHSDTFELVAENIQIANSERTIGELDLIIKDTTNKLYHIEVAYKFYLYDESLGKNEIDQWIGPNRKDSLVEKINKLKSKQFPLLFENETQQMIKQLKVNPANIEQKVIFKGQLFIPFGKTVDFKNLNKACVSGHYINYNDLETLQNNSFYIPNKPDWLSLPNPDVKWLTYNETNEVLHNSIAKKKSNLVWLKDTNNSLSKVFITWW